MNNRPQAHKEEKSWGAERWYSGLWGARQVKACSEHLVQEVGAGMQLQSPHQGSNKAPPLRGECSAFKPSK